METAVRDSQCYWKQQIYTLTKYDFLVTEVQDKLVQTIQLLQADGEIEPELSLREIYDKYFHPNVIPLETAEIWNALGNNTVINCFQFDSQVGAQAAKMIKPRNVREMSAANGLMRLMGEDGEERPLEKYVKQKNNISLWYKEMDNEGLTKQEQKIIEPYFKPDFGVPPDQESLMLMLMDENICGFTLSEANAARKVVGKKQMNKIPELREKVLKQAKSEKLGQYIWKRGVGPQMGYSFSRIHALAYSFIGVQTLYIATHWNPIYWDTACLIVNSGSLEDNSEEEIVDIFEPEMDDLVDGVTFEDLPDRKSKVRRTASTDYGKVAKAIGDVISEGIKVSLVDINKSDFGFKPDVANNQILFGLKGMLNVSDSTVLDIIKNRPYSSPRDFINKVHPGKQAMVALIKGGAFDAMMDRKLCMGWYIWETCDKKTNLTLQNMSTLMKYNLLPSDSEDFILAKKVYEFNRYLKEVCAKGDKINYHPDTRAIDFLTKIGLDDLMTTQANEFILNAKAWDKHYQKYMDTFRKWMSENKTDILRDLNAIIFKADWDKYAQGTISAWEMEVLCFYYHDHELKNVNNSLYGFADFSKLPEEPVIVNTFKRGGKEIHLYDLHRICGTCIAKNKAKSTVTLLTTTGVVNVKFRKEYFSLFDKQISVRGADGKKHVVEKSWFKRGSMIVVNGMRSGDDFISKKYSSTSGHQLYKIDEIYEDGTISLSGSRYQGDENV